MYGVVRSSGCSVSFSALSVVFFIVILPYMWYKDWQYDRLPEEQKGFGKWEDLKGARDATGLVIKKDKNVRN